MIKTLGLTAILVGGSLAVGILGYHFTEDLPWVDSFLNAAMILSGMGPADQVKTTAGKLFAGCYALYSGLVVIISAALILAPVFHRVMHRFHLEEDQQRD